MPDLGIYIGHLCFNPCSAVTYGIYSSFKRMITIMGRSVLGLKGTCALKAIVPDWNLISLKDIVTACLILVL